MLLTARQRAWAAIALDLIVVAIVVSAAPRDRLLVACVGAAVVVLAAFATRIYALGFGLAVIRATVAVVLVFASARFAAALLLLAGAELVSATNGWSSARAARRASPRRRPVVSAVR